MRSLEFGLYTTPDNFLEIDLDEEIRTQLHINADDPASTVNEHIKGHSPDRSGALIADEVYKANYPVDDDILMFFYTDWTNQVSEYHRTYARFVEGPDLGYTSPYTPNPSHMYTQTINEDMGFLQAWAEDVIDQVVQKATAP